MIKRGAKGTTAWIDGPLWKNAAAARELEMRQIAREQAQIRARKVKAFWDFLPELALPSLFLLCVALIIVYFFAMFQAHRMTTKFADACERTGGVAVKTATNELACIHLETKP